MPLSLSLLIYTCLFHTERAQSFKRPWAWQPLCPLLSLYTATSLSSHSITETKRDTRTSTFLFWVRAARWMNGWLTLLSSCQARWFSALVCQAINTMIIITWEMRMREREMLIERPRASESQPFISQPLFSRGRNIWEMPSIYYIYIWGEAHAERYFPIPFS